MMHLQRRRSRSRRASIGIAIDGTTVCSVVVRHGHLVWAAEEALQNPEDLGSALVRLVSEACRTGRAGAGPRWPGRPKLHIAVGRPFVRTKLLAGLPTTGDPSLLRAVVAADVGRFFVNPGARPSQITLHRRDDGTVWGAAYPEDLIDSLVHASGAAGVQLRYVAPATTSATVQLAVPARDVRDVMDDHRCAMAAAVACDGAANPLALRLDLPAVSRPRAAPYRYGMLGLACTALLAALMMPGAVAQHESSRAATALRALQRPLARALDRRQQLSRVTARLNSAATFAAGRRSMTEVLAQLTAGLPRTVAVTSLELDGAGGTIVVVGREVARAAPALEELPLVASAELAGVVTREQGQPAVPSMLGQPTDVDDVTGDVPARERATIRFHFRAIPSPVTTDVAARTEAPVQPLSHAP